MFFEKLANIQKSLQGKFEVLTYESLIPVISEECYKQNIVFYFNFIENTAILKMREFTSKSADLTLRYHYVSDNLQGSELEELKKQLLLNTFLITPKDTGRKPVIKESSSVPPKPIRNANEHISKRGVPVTKSSIENYLNRYEPIKDMDQDTKKAVLTYLKGMKK